METSPTELGAAVVISICGQVGFPTAEPQDRTDMQHKDRVSPVKCTDGKQTRIHARRGILTPRVKGNRVWATQTPFSFQTHHQIKSLLTHSGRMERGAEKASRSVIAGGAPSTWKKRQEARSSRQGGDGEQISSLPWFTQSHGLLTRKMDTNISNDKFCVKHLAQGRCSKMIVITIEQREEKERESKAVGRELQTSVVGKEVDTLARTPEVWDWSVCGACIRRPGGDPRGTVKMWCYREQCASVMCWSWSHWNAVLCWMKWKKCY